MNTHDAKTPEHILASANQTFDTEIKALRSLQQRLGQPFVQAVHQILQCEGRVVVTGLGKTGHIARKIAATLASTGTPAFFMHAGEAMHGDLGMLTSKDLLIGISYSGSGNELMTIVTVAGRLGTPVIAMTGNAQSALATSSDIHLDVHVTHEACPLDLAPTSSTTASLVLGDALAVACLQARGFSHEDFARSHPGGTLGRRLLTRVSDVMRQGSALPVLGTNLTVPEALAEMSAKGMGMTIIVNEQGRPEGIFTDGDLRRLITRVGDIRQFPVMDGMTRQPRTIAPDVLAVEAAAIMDSEKINQILVVDSGGLLLGALHMHDLLAAKVI